MSVALSPYDPCWPARFEAEKTLILKVWSAGFAAIHHIGSTSIPGILAKPIIDMLGEVADFDPLDRSGAIFQGLGYEVMGAFGIAGRRYFRKSSDNGRRSHHLHVFETGSPHLERHLAFRDYLRAHTDIAAEYSDLKARLVEKGVCSEAYMDGKDPFIKHIEAQALGWARAR